MEDRFGFLAAVFFVAMRVFLSSLDSVLVQKVFQGEDVRESFLVQVAQLKLIAFPLMTIQYPLKEFLFLFQSAPWLEFYKTHPAPAVGAFEGVLRFFCAVVSVCEILVVNLLYFCYELIRDPISFAPQIFNITICGF